MEKTLKKFFVFICFLGSVYAQAMALEAEIEGEYATFRSTLIPNKVNQPCPAVQFIQYLQENAAKVRNAAQKIARIIGSGAGVGGISDREATPEERTLILKGINFAVEQKIQEEEFNLELKGFDDYIGKHQTVVADLINRVQKGENLLLNNNLINSLRAPANPHNAAEGEIAIGAPGGARAGVQSQTIDGEEEQPGAQPSQPQQAAAPAAVHPSAWSSLNASQLSIIYEQTYNKPLLNGHRVYLGQPFPINLVTRPGGWEELVRVCAEGRSGSYSPECIYSDVCFNIADQFHWLDGGQDPNDTGRQARHIVSKMGLGLNRGIELFGKLGYGLGIRTVSQGIEQNLKKFFGKKKGSAAGREEVYFTR